MSTVLESDEDSECRSRRYSTPASHDAASPRAESAGNLHDIGLYHRLTDIGLCHCLTAASSVRCLAVTDHWVSTLLYADMVEVKR